MHEYSITSAMRMASKNLSKGPFSLKLKPIRKYTILPGKKLQIDGK